MHVPLIPALSELLTRYLRKMRVSIVSTIVPTSRTKLICRAIASCRSPGLRAPGLHPCPLSLLP